MSIIEEVKHCYEMMGKKEDDAKYFLEQIKKIEESYLNLPRSIEKRAEVTACKFLIQKWRQDLAQYIITNYQNKYFDCLQSLNLLLKPNQLEKIMNYLSEKEKNLLSLKRGNDFPKIKVQPFKHSSWSFKRWSKKKAFTEFETIELGVRYRGIDFHQGDLLMVSPKLESGGLFTVFSEPDSFSAHLALFVMLKKDELYIPSILEIHEHGVRALPLNLYLSENFSTYVEVLRAKDFAITDFDKISNVAFDLMSDCQGYSFHTDDRDKYHYTCTRLATEFRKRLGLKELKAKSTFTIKEFRTNLDHLEFKFKTILEPNDFLCDENYRLVGVIDNQLLHFEVWSRLSINSYLNLFSTKILNLNSLGLAPKVFMFATVQIQKKTLLGKCLAKVFGYSTGNFPMGPKELLSYFYFTDKKITALANAIARDIEKLVENEFVFDFMQFERSKEVQSILQEKSNCLKNLF